MLQYPSARVLRREGSEKEVSAPKNPSSRYRNRRMIERRAVDAVIWGLPLVSEDAVKQAYFRDGKAKYNDIVWWPKGGGWKNQSPTPNVNTRYMYFFINTKQDGPVVVELPLPSRRQLLRHYRRRLVCAARGHWLRGQGRQIPRAATRLQGGDSGGYTAVRPNMHNTMTLLRSILASYSEKDVQA